MAATRHRREPLHTRACYPRNNLRLLPSPVPLRAIACLLQLFVAPKFGSIDYLAEHGNRHATYLFSNICAPGTEATVEQFPHCLTMLARSLKADTRVGNVRATNVFARSIARCERKGRSLVRWLQIFRLASGSEDQCLEFNCTELSNTRRSICTCNPGVS